MQHYTAIMHDTTKNTFHPMPFRVCLFPDQIPEEGERIRYRSVGFHRKGFSSVKEAFDYIEESPTMKNTGHLLKWDGIGDDPSFKLFFPYVPYIQNTM